MSRFTPTPPIFLKAIGWIEIGRDDDSPLTSFIRAVKIGGMVWEGEDEYKTLNEAFQDLEQGLTQWMQEEGMKPM